VRRFVWAGLFVAVAWAFGGPPGAAVGLAVVVARAFSSRPSRFWLAGLAGLAAAAVSVLVQGLPSGAVTPEFPAAHWVSHLLVGVALACFAMAIWMELPGRAGEP
jgi:hypothetical protein